MSAFDVLVSAVWSEARQDGGTLLQAFAGPSSDAGRARRALRLPHLAGVRQRLLADRQDHQERHGKDADRAARAVDRAVAAAGTERHLEAVLDLSEAVRFSPARSDELLLALERRADALLCLEQLEASVRDLAEVREALEYASREPSTVSRLLRTLLSMASRLQLSGNGAQAEPVLREALLVVRDAGDLLDAAAKTEAVTAIMQRLKNPDKKVLSAPPLVSSGLDALPKLFAGPHPSLRAASAAVELREDPVKGRHLVATRHIPAGSALILETPFAWSLALEETPTHCLHCCSPVLAGAPCPDCSDVVFCSRGCRDAALAAYHPAECGMLVHLVPRVPPRCGGEGGGGAAPSELSPMALLAYRIVVTAAELAGQVGQANQRIVLPQPFVELHQDDEGRKKRRKKKTATAEYDAVFAQVTHSDRRTPADLLKRSLTAAFLTACLEAVLGASRARPEPGQDTEVLTEVLTEEQRVVLTAAFLRHLQGCSCNAYQISEHQLGGGSVRGARGVELGGACLPTVSLVNHACSPNVARHSHGNVCVVRAARAIPKGGELLDNYGPHFLEHDREERRAALAKQYMFDCECEACANDWPTLEALEQHPQQHARRGKRPSSADQLEELSARMRAGVQGLLEGRYEEALQSALWYSAALAALQQPRRPPCGEQVRADQVVSLCWSLAGNTVRY